MKKLGTWMQKWAKVEFQTQVFVICANIANLRCNVNISLKPCDENDYSAIFTGFLEILLPSYDYMLKIKIVIASFFLSQKYNFDCPMDAPYYISRLVWYISWGFDSY